MSDKKWTLALEILAGNQALLATVKSSQSSINKFVNQTRTEIQSIGRAWTSTAGKLAGIGLSFGTVKLLSDSAKLERGLTRIALSAGRTKEDARGMKEEIEDLGIKTGQSSEVLEGAFKSIYNLTGSWDAARESISSINAAVAVTGAGADQLGSSLAVAADAFNIDLTKPQAASDLLNKMAALGKGAGGLSNIAEIFNSIALPASMTGMNADSALQFIGMLSKVTKNPAQMGALADNTLRMFTNLRVLGKMKGVKLFDDQGNRRNPLLVLQDIQKQYEKLDAKAQSKFLIRLLNGGDPRAMRSLQFLFESGAVNSLDKLKSTMDNAGGGIEKKLPEAVNNAADQAARLKNLLEKAGDSFANPINKAIADLIQYGMDKKGLSGGQIVGLGVAGGLTAWLAKNVASRNISALLNKIGLKGPVGGLGTLGGIAEGKAYQAATGVMPVFVVNWGDGGAMFSGHGLSGSKWQEYIGLPTTAGGAAAGAGLTASIIAIAGPVALGLLASAAIWSVARRELGLMKQENEDAKIKEKLGIDPVLNRDRNAAPADKRGQAMADALGGKEYNVSDLFYKEGQQTTYNQIRLDVYIDDKGKVVSRASGEQVDMQTNVKRGKFETQAVLDRMFTGSER